MLKTNTHLHFNGCCEEALKFYAKGLGGKITFIMTWGDSPAAKDMPARWAKKIIHANFQFEGQMISADDAPPGYQSKMQGFSIILNSPSLARAKKAFQALSKGGKIRMAFAKTFWSPGFGMLVDKFGVPWMVSTDSRK